jgi:beta-ureidopropionase / N-carbamoyl-L-amino-acid hydrolase
VTSTFEQLWAELEPIGRDPQTGGYHRFAWTAVDAQLRAWFVDQAGRRGLSVETDRNGNLWAWWGAPGPNAVVTGSHLDSVPGGGPYDGPLGVVSALCAVDELRARGVTPERPLAVALFADEEGARFGMACIGSRLMSGALAPDAARALRDTDGITLAEAMAHAGLDAGTLGPDDELLAKIGCFVELHVEQGRHLADLDAAVGVASAIWPHGRWRFTFTGQPNHAGTTRLVDRHDPVLPLAVTVLAAREAAQAQQGVATIGKVEVVPGAVNGVAARATAWLDARAADDATVTAIVTATHDAAASSARQHGVEVTLERESYTEVVGFDVPLRDRIAAVLNGALILPTGAGHDAGILAARVPTAMLFVRNPSGVSHSPEESAELLDCLAGVTALADVLADLTRAG